MQEAGAELRGCTADAPLLPGDGRGSAGALGVCCRDGKNPKSREETAGEAGDGGDKEVPGRRAPSRGCRQLSAAVPDDMLRGSISTES